MPRIRNPHVAVLDMKSTTSALVLMIATTMAGQVAAQSTQGVFSSCVTENSIALTYDDGPRYVI